MFEHRPFELKSKTDYMRFGDYLAKRDRRDIIMIDCDAESTIRLEIPIEKYPDHDYCLCSDYEIGYGSDHRVLMYVNLKGMEKKAKELFGE